MKITCPQCNFTRNVDDKALPPRAVMATCPKCAHRFKFRERPLQIKPPVASSAPQEERAPAPPAVEPPLIPQEEAHSPEFVQAPAELAEEKSEVQADSAPSEMEEDLWENLEALNEDEEDDQDSFEPGVSTLPLWERARSGYPRAFVQTGLDVLSNPRRFFTSMTVNRDIIKPLLFFLIIVEAVALSQSVWQLLGILPAGPLMEDVDQNLRAALVLITYPIQVAAFLFLDAGINHLLLQLFKADTKGFLGTFRAGVYSSVPMLFLMIPYIGWPMAAIGVTVYKFIGLKYIHRASTQQILAVLAMPVLLAMIAAVLIVLLSGGAPLP